MSPDQIRISELEKEVKVLRNFMLSFNNVGQLAPQAQKTIQVVAGNATLDGLSNVVITAPSSGQVLKYNGTDWINGTDNT